MNREPKILLIEDSEDYQTLISEALMPHLVKCSSSAEAALRELELSSFDLILLDIGLPDKSGFSLLSEIQSNSNTCSIPVICITGRTEIKDKVTAFSLGADDYLPKPFDLIELKARVDSKLKKAHLIKDSSRGIRIGNLRMDLNSHQVSVIDESGRELEIPLTQTEFKLLILFSKNPTTLFTRQKILNEVWGSSVKVSDRVIDVHLCSLRKKIRMSDLRITPVTGAGYRLTIGTHPNQEFPAPLQASSNDEAPSLRAQGKNEMTPAPEH
ncbi:MAG: response regulator transcription factor [Bdellovibrionales bacterium]|nr:response regulator transcription factor [Bdellovibrionales bacterium]